MGDPNKWEIRESGVCSGQGPAGLWGPNVRLPSPEVKGLPSWPRAQADGPPCSSVLYLCWLTQGLMGHLNATLLAFSTVTLRAGTRCDSLMLCFPLTPRREKRKWFSLAMLSSRDISLWAKQDFWYICHLLLWPGEKMGHLESVPTALGFKWTIPSLPWPLPLAKAVEAVCKTGIIKERLHTEQIGYTNIGSFA